MCQACLSERRPALGPQVGEGVNLTVVLLPTTIWCNVGIVSGQLVVGLLRHIPLNISFFLFCFHSFFSLFKSLQVDHY